MVSFGESPENHQFNSHCVTLIYFFCISLESRHFCRKLRISDMFISYLFINDLNGIPRDTVSPLNPSVFTIFLII